MTQLVRAGLIQMAQPAGAEGMTPIAIRDAMIEAHLKLIDEAGAKGVQVLCMQELFYGPYFCPSQDSKWYSITEAVPDGPTTRLMQEYAKKRVKQLGLAGPGQVRINKAGCLDRCEEGPTVVVYPEGTWYTYVDETDIDEIVVSHLQNGQVVERLKIDR